LWNIPEIPLIAEETEEVTLFPFPPDSNIC